LYAIAGGLLALGLYKPQFVLQIAGILSLHRRWRLLLGFLSTALALGAISLAMVGWHGLLGLVSLWLPMFKRGDVVWPELMLNLRGLVYITLDLAGLSKATNTLTLCLSIWVYILTLRAWRRGVDEEQQELLDLRFALAVVTTALVSFHLYSYDGTLAAIPLIIMLNQVLKEANRYQLSHRLFLAILSLMFLPLLPNILLNAAMLAWWALPLPAIFVVLLTEIWRRTSPAGPSVRT
jgi:hypothetical protein